jgi:hypothetical protein
LARVHQSTWETIGIADALSLLLSPLDKNENFLKTIGYFWSDALNCFLFGHSLMTPTLMDVVMITGLDIASPSPSAYNRPEVPFMLSFKLECTNWGAYLNQHVKTKGPVTEREHMTFLNFWLEHFIFCCPSLAPTKNYLSLAYELAKGATIGLIKLFLGEVYMYLHLMSSSLLSQKKLKPVVLGGSLSCGLIYIFRVISQTSLFWPIFPFQIKLRDASDVLAMARPCTVFMEANKTSKTH